MNEKFIPCNYLLIRIIHTVVIRRFIEMTWHFRISLRFLKYTELRDYYQRNENIDILAKCVNVSENMHSSMHDPSVRVGERKWGRKRDLLKNEHCIIWKTCPFKHGRILLWWFFPCRPINSINIMKTRIRQRYDASDLVMYVDLFK